MQLGAEQLGAEQLGTEQLNREGFTLQPFGIPADFRAVSDRDSTSGVFLDADVVYQTLLLPFIHFKHPASCWRESFRTSGPGAITPHLAT